MDTIAPDANLMAWPEALQAMLSGHAVRRQSESGRTLVGTSNGVPIWDCGAEAIRLAAAWTADNRPVHVFQGAESRVLFVPEHDHVSATDWQIVE